jgi:hypothetical protein
MKLKKSKYVTEKDVKDTLCYYTIRQTDLQKKLKITGKFTCWIVYWMLKKKTERAKGIRQKKIDRKHNVSIWYLVQRTTKEPNSSAVLKD